MGAGLLVKDVCGVAGACNAAPLRACGFDAFRLFGLSLECRGRERQASFQQSASSHPHGCCRVVRVSCFFGRVGGEY